MARNSGELESCLKYSLGFKPAGSEMAEKLQNVADGATIASQATSCSISGCRVATKMQQGTAESRWVAQNITRFEANLHTPKDLRSLADKHLCALMVGSDASSMPPMCIHSRSWLACYCSWATACSVLTIMP